MLPHKQIESQLQASLRVVLPDADSSSVLLRPCPDPKFGDYQTSALMALAKGRNLNPRAFAENVVKNLDVTGTCEKVEIAGAGFLNFRLKTSALKKTLESAASGGALFFENATRPKTVVVDFSSPNVAKPMHVGHIRSTFLGDSLARALRLLGHRVIADNHIGDWGTQFGKLLLGWKKGLNLEHLKADPISEMGRLYKWINGAAESDPALLEEARVELVKLQSGDPENLKIWREMITLSEKQFDEIYKRLGIKFHFTYGESFYNDRLAPLVEELLRKTIARESDGAIAVFFEDDPQLKGKPALIRKSDGGFNYSTTDLATLSFRIEQWHPDEIIYVTDGRQQLHFQQIFAAFKKWQPSSRTKLAHVWFGTILGEDGKPFKTRSGETVKLTDLLDEAEARAFQIVSDKNPDLPEAMRREIARVVGIGAVKYADLLPNRQSDYVFSWDKMLALNGNTAPYLQYAYARIRSIFKKADQPATLPANGVLKLVEPEEISLAKHLLNFGITLEAVVAEYRPNFLCIFLYELAGKFTAFYEKCPVLKADSEIRRSRLLLCDLTGRVIKLGLNTLGIETADQM